MPRILLLSCARSGSTYLLELLNSHPECHVDPELLNGEVSIHGDPHEYLEKRMSSHPETFVGFKVFPGQFKEKRVKFCDVVEKLGVTFIIVLYRENILETMVSYQIAGQTKVWYSTEKPTEENRKKAVMRIEMDPKTILNGYKERKEHWDEVMNEWPSHVQPIFVKYEELIENPKKWLHHIFAQMSCQVPQDVSFFSICQRQNPAPVWEKVVNWNQLPQEVRQLQLNVEDMFHSRQPKSVSSSLEVPDEIRELIPLREPPMPAGGWRYRVADPYMPTALKENVMDAISSGSISSAGLWPRMMSMKLKWIFGVPVAQPCNNGFTALVLAIQAIGVEPGDEVIMPSFTMIAVGNAAAFLGATPVFVDSSKDDYNPSWEIIQNSISHRTKIVILTHTYGLQNPELEKIARECKNRKIWLIEDISECVGVRVRVDKEKPIINGLVNGNGHLNEESEEEDSESDEEDDEEPTKLLGTFGDFACASMYANKMVHAGDGGFVLAKDPKFGPRLTSLVNHGFTPSYHFLHFEVCVNAKINGVGAAMACGCLDNLDKIMEHRSQVAALYRKFLGSIPHIKLMPVCGAFDTPWVFGIECRSRSERTELRRHLANHGIETRDFFFPLHLQPAFLPPSQSPSQSQEHGKQKRLKVMAKQPTSMSNCEKFGSIGFYLPTHSNLTREDCFYISSVVHSFFDKSKNSKSVSKSVQSAPALASKLCVQIQPDGFGVEIRAFDSSGERKQVQDRGHLYIETVKLGLEAEENLIREKWDEKERFLTKALECIKKAKEEGAPSIEPFLNPYVQYFQSQRTVEQPAAKPWLKIDLTSNKFSDAQKIPTTTDVETLQLLAWLVEEMEPKIIWEIGTWFGHATALMAACLKGQKPKIDSNKSPAKIFACDAYRWQKWMELYVDPEILERYNYNEFDSFLEAFEDNVRNFQDTIHAVEWPYDISQLPEILREDQNRPDLIFLDSTQESEDLDNIWSIIQPNLIPDRTLIVFNGLAHSSMKFFTEHSNELIPVAKPNTIAKVFRYCPVKSNPDSSNNNNTQAQDAEDEIPIERLPRKLRFPPEVLPQWEHHHQNAFGQTVHLLQEEFHDDDASVLFIPAVEETVCDHPELLMENPWIGIIHAVAHHPELFYAPDLHKMCSRDYVKVMRNCRGLFTLTNFQKNYLLEHWPKSLLPTPIPVQSIIYPIVSSPDSPLVSRSNSGSKVPELWKQNKLVELVLIGSFARDFSLFFNQKVPTNLRKVLLAGDEIVSHAHKKAVAEAEAPLEPDVILMPRQNTDEYEALLLRSLIFLSLKYDGAANTLILECIQRNVPIIAPRFESVTQYIGSNYPLLYDPNDPKLTELITLENVEKAIHHFENMDKTGLHPQKFLSSIREGAVMASVPPCIKTSLVDPFQLQMGGASPSKFDVTISICSYKRTHHLKRILDSLWNTQDFGGTFQIIIWNNNDCRSQVVRDICRSYVEGSTERRSLEVIQSTSNYYCSIRFALAPLMKSDVLLICDDDIFPQSNFISFFYKAHGKHPKDVLCVRGHSFLPHQLNLENPREVWQDYENLKFHDDSDTEQLIHFVHADACLIPREAIQEMASQRIPKSSSFELVDDYWMSFVLSHRFGRKLRKLSTKNSSNNSFSGNFKNESVLQGPFERAPDSDQVGLALHTRPEVFDARIRLYIHHMLEGWPSWKPENIEEDTLVLVDEDLRRKKMEIWDTFFIGFNISSRIDDEGIQALSNLGTRCVRIGAVGVGRRIEYELQPFSQSEDDASELLDRLRKLVDRLAEKGISVVFTLDRRVASSSNWIKIASAFKNCPSVVGYDLINEPYTSIENDISWCEVASTEDAQGSLKVMEQYIELIRGIRTVDKNTPIIIEPTFWGSLEALDKLSTSTLLKEDPNLIISFHFYEPALLTQTRSNKGRFQFPGSIPLYDHTKESPLIDWDASEILRRFIRARDWSKGTENKVKIFCGEFGICRNISGADEYLKAIITACRESGISGFIFSFRDDDWSDMNYEFGSDPFNFTSENESSLMKIIRRGIQDQDLNLK